MTDSSPQTKAASQETTTTDTVPLCVVGTLAFDDVETPSGRRDGVLGGSATYFGVAASYFTEVGLVGVVGRDFPDAFREQLEGHGLSLDGVEVQEEGSTFHWAGRYEGTMDQAETLATDLNVLSTFEPKLPEAWRRTPYVFLANTDPAIQLSVIDQLEDPRLVVADTMNLWIDNAREPLLEVLRRVDGLTLNDAEARTLAGTTNLIGAGRRLLEMGPRFVLVKKGEHGAFLFSEEREFALPSYPLEEVVDPTGAGDSFAGGILGHLAGSGGRRVEDVRRSMLYGTVVASFTVSDFSLGRLGAIDRAQIEARARELHRFTMV